jgi:glycosyltransferase involved in cell wall biosynthesis
MAPARAARIVHHEVVAVSPVRVLLVTKGLDIGGIERMVVDLAKGLAREGAVVHVAVVNDGRDQLLGLVDQSMVTVHRLGGSDRIGARAAWRLARLVRSPRFDVVHVHGPLPAVVARLVPGGCPVVTTSHTPLGALRWPTRMAWRLTARGDAATVAVSAAVAGSLPPRVAARATVIPHGLDADAIAVARERAQSASRAAGDVVAVTVASHRDAKNYPNLLHAVRAACAAGAPLRLVAVGDGPDLQRHRELVHELGLDLVVEFQPPTVDVLDVIAGADMLVVASDYEGQPLVVMEALALGVPVVATAVGRVPELVSPAVGRVVAPGDPAALGAALAELAADAGLRATLAGNASQRTEAWTLHDVAAAHLALYERVATAAST